MTLRARSSQRFVQGLCLVLVFGVVAVALLFVPAEGEGDGLLTTDAGPRAENGLAAGNGPGGERDRSDRRGSDRNSAAGAAAADDATVAAANRDSRGGRAEDAAARRGDYDRRGRGSAAGGSQLRPDLASSSLRSDGRTWRRDGTSSGSSSEGNSADDVPESAQMLPEVWTLRVATLDGSPAAVALGLFAPQEPHELRHNQLYGAGSLLGTVSLSTNPQGRISLPLGEVLAILGENPEARNTDDVGGIERFARMRIGVLINDARFEPIVATVPVRTNPDAPPQLTLTDANFVEIHVREEVSNTPLPGAEVELWRFDPTEPQVPLDTITLRTDSSGTIQSRIMPERSYAFRVRKEGYATSRTERFVCERQDVSYQIPLYRGNFLAGVVVDPGGAPVADANVVCRQQGNAGLGEDQTTTDAFGQFYLNRIPHSDFRSEAWVTVRASGYATLVRQVLVNSDDVRLQLSHDAGITGVVHPPDGGTLRLPAYVVATQRLYGNQDVEFDRVPVGTDGTFELAGAVAGQVRLVAETEHGERSAPATVAFDPASPAQVELQLQPAARLFVRAQRDDGVPVAGLHVRSGEWDGETDASGTLLWDSLFPGEGNVRVVPDEPNGTRASGADLVYFVPDPTGIQLRSGETTEVTITLSVWLPPTETTPVQVVFQGDPLVGGSGTATVVTRFSGGQETNTHSVNFVDGIGTITVTMRTDPSVPAEHELRFEHPDYEPESRGQSALAAAAQEEVPLIVELTRVPSLSLQIIDRGGAHVERAGVQLWRGGSRRAAGESDGVGRLLLTHLEEGPYRLIAFKHGYRRTEFDIHLPITTAFDTQEREDGSRLELLNEGTGTSADPSRLLLTMSNAGDVTVRVTTMHGSAAVGARILVKRRQTQGSPLQIFDLGTLDGQGQKVVRLHWDVPYQVVAFSGTEIAFANFYNDPEEPIYSVDMDMEPRGTISGRVTNSNGSAARNVEVRLIPSAGPLVGTDNYFSARTDQNGNWSIAVPASSTFTATCPDEPGTTPVTSVAPGTSGVTLVRGQ